MMRPAADMTVPDVLAAAADYLEHVGWCQHVMIAEDGLRRCVAGAILAVAAGQPDLQWAAVRAVIREVSGEVPRPGFSNLTAWNDTPGRTVEEIVTTLRNAKRQVLTSDAAQA